ncbi:AraC family transcriptional regulator [Polyangium sorediatum]|uniref:AraC family transcriptional regulator n=1 Tax=Polyangium sorediatum TaxID=889274 RepID=A0ABT6PAK6_9BACT|nr:AraC family transcriptional regulator [Polyangium sorediatum]MDI1437665.1 AraC family transcriptional regulator [Polyangium sorediatum]
MPPAFDELARTLRLQGTEVQQADLGARWGKQIPSQGKARVYAALRGGGWVGQKDQRIALQQGEIVFLPRGDAHSVRDKPTTPVVGFADPYCKALRPSGPNAIRTEAPPETRLVIVDLRFDAAGAPWLSLLPSLVHLQGSHPGLARWLGETLHLLAEAPDLSPPLRDGIVEAFGHTLFACALRTLASPLPGREALQDEPIAAALAEVRAAPEQSFELGELARRVGLSRSAFAARATALLGEPLGSYVRRLRLDRAAALLAGTALPIKVIAARVGYDSEAAFTRAFTRAHGKGPRDHRLAHAAGRAGADSFGPGQSDAASFADP